MNVKKILGLAARDPLFFAGKVWDRLRLSMFAPPDGPREILIDGVRFRCDFNLGPAVGQMFLRIYEKAEVRLLRKILKPGGTFIDVGANIGYISAQAASCVGEGGEVHSFEPIPLYFERLENLRKDNPRHKIFANNFAIGKREGTLDIDINLRNIGWNTLVPGFMPEEDRRETRRVRVVRLDNYIKEHKLENISLIKIDTEGYEFSVLESLSSFFDMSPERPPMLVEICPMACGLQGYALPDLEDYMRKYSYNARSILSNARINLPDLRDTTDVLFLPET